MIIGIAGKIGSGKSTICRFLHGYIMKNIIPHPSIEGEKLIDSYQIDEVGNLLVPFEDDNKEKSYGILDIDSRDPEVQSFLAEFVWPYVRSESFAGYLKEIASVLFDIKEENLYGTQEEKGQPTHLKWEDMAGVVDSLPTTKAASELAARAKLQAKTGQMSAREFMQYFGTDVCRRLYPHCWAKSFVKRCAMYASLYTIAQDVRFENEAQVIKESGGVVIYLNRYIERECDNIQHSSEQFDPALADIIIDNQNMTIEESCLAVLEQLKAKGVI